MSDREPTNEQLEAAKAVLLPSLIRDPERGSLSSCVTLIRLALRASLSVGGSITPHPEARETDTGFSVTSEEYLAQIDAAVARGDAPAYMAEMLRKALADGKQAFDSPGVLKDAATLTTEPTGAQIRVACDAYNEVSASEFPCSELAMAAALVAAGGSFAPSPSVSTDPGRDAWLAKYGDLRGFIDPGVEGAP